MSFKSRAGLKAFLRPGKPAGRPKEQPRSRIGIVSPLSHTLSTSNVVVSPLALPTGGDDAAPTPASAPQAGVGTPTSPRLVSLPSAQHFSVAEGLDSEDDVAGVETVALGPDS